MSHDGEAMKAFPVFVGDNTIGVRKIGFSS
jgi:hypothetical protein